MTARNLKYTETFYSTQGEGQYIGVPSLWMRFYLCNLECRGFGQDDPTNPETYKPVGNDFDLKDITNINDLPVFPVGCDSAYSVAKRYRHLITDLPVSEAVDELTALLPHGRFQHPHTEQWSHMVFTGGEPMLKNTQSGIIAVLNEFAARNNASRYVTIETNGTKPVTPELSNWVKNRFYEDNQAEWYWSVSPKLWNTSGEKPEKTIKPKIVEEYAQVSNRGQLKFVVNGREESWKEVEQYTRWFRDAGVQWPVWIMSVGGTVEGLKMTEAAIADEAIQRGYYYTSRMQNHIYGNAIGK